MGFLQSLERLSPKMKKAVAVHGPDGTPLEIYSRLPNDANTLLLSRVLECDIQTGILRSKYKSCLTLTLVVCCLPELRLRFIRFMCDPNSHTLYTQWRSMVLAFAWQRHTLRNASEMTSSHAS